MDFVRGHCSVDSDEFDILVAVQEALANAALHGCRNDPSKSISCTVSVRPDEVEIVVRDPGNGFEEEKVADPKSLETNYSESGRGISLMRGLMSEVTYCSGGSEVHLKKLLHRSHQAESSLLNRIAV
jgi:serine/threonine-protein kinase RsbW